MNKFLMGGSARAAAFALAFLPVTAYAQDAVQPSADPAQGDDFDSIVVTGRAARSDLRKAEASFAVTTISDDRLRLTAPISTAEVFKQVPGFWVESSGGEGSNNVRSRGIPTDGYSSVALQENGLSVQYDGGLGYLNADQSFRFDETVERVEAVRGGPASIFAPNAPGGVVNFITRKGTEDTGGLVKLEYGDYDHYRIDAYYGTAFGNFGVFVGGFYRRDDGLRDPGFTANEGGQIRGTISYDDGEHSVSLDVKHIDDKVTFYLPVPLTFDAEGDIAEVPGFDAQKGTLAGPENKFVNIRNVGGDFPFDLTEGSHTKLTQITFDAQFDLGSGFGLVNKTRYRTSDILRNAVFPTGNITPMADYLTSVRAGALAAFPGATDVRMQYATDGAPFTATANGNGLVVGGNLLSVSVPLDEMITDTRLTSEFEAAGEHSFAIGGTYAFYDYRFDRYMGTALLEVAEQARRLDIVAVNATGNVVGKVTDNGFLRYGSLFDNVGIEVDAFAVYAGDEWQITPELRLDFAGRYERNDIRGLVSGKATVDLGDPTTLADNQVITANGQFIPVDQSFDDWGWTAGLNYQFSDNAGVFARYTDTFKLPSAGEYNGNPTRTDQSPVPITFAEIGAKYDGGFFNVFATGFYSKFAGIRFTDNVFNNQTNSYDQRFVTADTETWGVELEAVVRPVEYFDFSLQAAWQDPQYKGFVYTEIVNGQPVVRDFDGNQLIRVPKLSLRAVPGINLFDGRFRTELEVEYYSKRYADIANSQELPAFTALNINAQARITDSLTLQANVTNLTNEIGLTEGNPRAGSFVSGDAGAKYFLARPIFGRTFRAAISYKF